MRYVLLCVTLFWGTVAMAIEEPKYSVLSVSNTYEIRRYDDRVAVETQQADGENGAFSRLFKYISGANEQSSKVAMTVPVTQSVKISMTAPVTQEAQADGVTMRFFLPATYNFETAPIPTDPKVRLVLVKGADYAVHKYSGRSTDQNFNKASKLLLEALEKDGVSTKGIPIKATYNGPFTPFFARRNEAMIEVKY